jgi:hypothetical protein
VGYRPRLAALCSWILLVSVQNRQPLITHGGDRVFRLLLFWSIFLPLTARGGKNASDMPRIALSPESAALLLQVGLIYIFSVVFKLADPAWIRLSAVADSLRVEGVATDLGRALLAFTVLLRGLTVLSLVVESAAPLLAFSPWKTGAIRMWLVFGMAAFHCLGIGGTMNLGLMEYVMLIAWLPFLPTSFWERWCSQRRSSRATVSRMPTPGLALNAFVLVAFALVLADNLMSLDRARYRAPGWVALKVPIRTLALSQSWRLWSTPCAIATTSFPLASRMAILSISIPAVHWIGTLPGVAHETITGGSTSCTRWAIVAV